MSRQKLEFIRHGGTVKRFHVWPTLTADTVAGHSFGVAWLCWLIAEEDTTLALIMAALSHDLAEHRTGDMPSHIRKKYPALNEALERIELSELRNAELPHEQHLTERERLILHIADGMDCMLYAVEELRLGNQNMNLVYERALSSVVKKGALDMPSTLALVNIIQVLYQEAKNGIGCIQSK